MIDSPFAPPPPPSSQEVPCPVCKKPTVLYLVNGEIAPCPTCLKDIIIP